MDALQKPLVLDGKDAAEQQSTKLFRCVLEGWGELVKCLACPFLCCMVGPIVVIEQGQVGVQTRFGVFERVLPPGLYVYNIMSQGIKPVSLKMQTLEIPRQAAITRDNLSVKVDAITFATVTDPRKATFQVENHHHAVKTLAASTLLRVIAEHDLQQIFGDRTKINERITHTLKDKTTGWGIDVAGVEIRDIKIADSMQRAMAQIAEANREANAKVIVAEGQRKAATIFAQAAEVMEKQPMSLQLQWFETLRQISAEKNSTVIVPDSMVGSLSDIANSARLARRNAPAGSNGTSSAGPEASTTHEWTQLPCAGGNAPPSS